MLIQLNNAIEVDEIECNIDEDLDNEHYTEKNINNSFINKLKDFSSFNPSGNKGKEKMNNSVIVIQTYDNKAKWALRESLEFAKNEHLFDT